MNHEAIRKIVGPSMVSVKMTDLLALLADRDALAADNEWLNKRLHWLQSPKESTSAEPAQTPTSTTIEAPDGSIEGGWDIQDGDEMDTVNIEPPAGDCSCKVPELSPKLQAYAEAIAPSTFERAVCGSRQPIGQVVESPAPLPVLKEKPFVKDKGAGKPSENVIPWKASYTPNQCRLALQIFAEGHHGVTVASQARVTKQTAHDIGKAYATQIEHMAGMSDKEREHFLESLYRQMLARWKAAGKDPAIQPELPLPTKTLREAAKPDKPSKGKAGNL